MIDVRMTAIVPQAVVTDNRLGNRLGIMPYIYIYIC